LAGTPSNESEARGGVVAGVWGGPLAYAGFGLELWHMAFTLGAEGGYVTQGVRGRVDANNPVAIGGAWLAVSAGIGWGQ
jgi:hypothetical protein